MSNYNQFLKSFIENEIYFLSDQKLQENRWQHASGEEPFGTFFLMFLETWHTILEHRSKFPLTFLQFSKIEKLVNMLKSFRENVNYPKTTGDYHLLLSKLEWRQIQQQAKQIYSDHTGI